MSENQNGTCRTSFASECSTVRADDSNHNLHATNDQLPNTAVAVGGLLSVSQDQVLLKKQIGEGQFGVVFRGTFRGQPCAVKMLKEGIKTNTIPHQRLLIELSILASLRPHVNVVGLLGACIEDLSKPLIIEELVNGQNLREYIKDKRDGFDLGQLKVYKWSLDILSALEYLHGLDPVIMHRDVKPANILIATESQTLKLADFGLAKQFYRDGDRVDKEGGHKLVRTHTGRIGTPLYTAPEVMACMRAGEHSTVVAVYTEKADVYSAALIIWYLLTGHRPRYLDEENPRARPDLGPARRRWKELAGLVELMWAHEAEMRPSARECVLAVREMAVGAPACGMTRAGEGCSVQ